MDDLRQYFHVVHVDSDPGLIIITTRLFRWDVCQDIESEKLIVCADYLIAILPPCLK